MVTSVANATQNTFRSNYEQYIFSAEVTVLFCDVIMAITIVVGIAGNVFICLCICKNRHLRTYMNVNVVSASVANIIGCACLLPIRMALYSGSPDDSSVHLLCGFGTFFRTLCDTMQFFMLTMASFERYQAVVNPFKKVGLQKRSAILVSLSWTVALSLGIISALFFIDSALYVPCALLTGAPYWNEYDMYLILPLGITLLSIITVFYGLILNTLFKHSLAMTRHIKKGTSKISPSPSRINDVNIHITRIGGYSDNVRNSTVSVTHSQGTIEVCKTAITVEVSREASSKLIAPNSTQLPELNVVDSDRNKTQYEPCLDKIDDGKIPSKHMQTSNLSSASSILQIPSESSNTIGTASTSVRSSPDILVATSSSQRKNTIQVVGMDGSVRVASTTDDHISGAVCLMSSKNRENGRRRVELKASKKIAILIGTFMCCWLPLPVFVISNTGNTPLSVSMFRALVVFGTLGSSVIAINPIMYGFVNRQLNGALRNLLKIEKCKCQKKI